MKIHARVSGSLRISSSAGFPWAGGRVACRRRWADIPQVKGLFFLSYPLHRPKSPDALGDTHLNKISRPMIFVAGTRDIYAEPKALKSAVSRLTKRAQSHWIEGADRNFNKHKGKAICSKTLREIVQTLNNWIDSHK